MTLAIEKPGRTTRSWPLPSQRRQVSTGVPGSAGEFMWAGYAGTYFWVDPKEELVGVYMMQSVRQLLPFATSFKTLVVQSIVE